jgi:hypothetical protein
MFSMLNAMFLDLKSNSPHFGSAMINIHDYIKIIFFPLLHVPSSDHHQHAKCFFLGLISCFGCLFHVQSWEYASFL